MDTINMAYRLATSEPVSFGDTVWYLDQVHGTAVTHVYMGTQRPDILGEGEAGRGTVWVLTPTGLSEVYAVDYGLYVKRESAERTRWFG